MSTPAVHLLTWVLSHDPYDLVVLYCEHVQAPEVGKNELAVCAVELREFSAGLPAQLLACGVRRVEFVPCAHEPHVDSQWPLLTPGHVGPWEPRRHWRHGETFAWNAIPVPRRAVFGIHDHAPIDLRADDQDRTIEALAVLADRGIAVASANDLGGASGLHLVADGCTACRVCVGSCPEGAMHLSTTELPGGTRTSILSHALDACRGCRMCLRLCPEQALSVAGHATLAEAVHRDVEVLASVSTRICTKCGAVFPDDGADLCPVCRYREENPFGSTLPPELLRQLPPDLAERLMKGQ